MEQDYIDFYESALERLIMSPDLTIDELSEMCLKEEFPEIKAMLESEQRFEIVGVLRRMPQNFLFKGLPDDIKDDYKLMDS